MISASEIFKFRLESDSIEESSLEVPELGISVTVFTVPSGKSIVHSHSFIISCNLVESAPSNFFISSSNFVVILEFCMYCVKSSLRLSFDVTFPSASKCPWVLHHEVKLLLVSYVIEPRSAWDKWPPAPPCCPADCRYPGYTGMWSPGPAWHRWRQAFFHTLL